MSTYCGQNYGAKKHDRVIDGYRKSLGIMAGITVIEVIGRFTIPMLMTSYLGFGVQGIWWSCGIVWAVSGATAWLRYLKYYNSVKGEISKN